MQPRLQAQLLYSGGIARLVGGVRGEEIVLCRRAQPPGAQGRHHGDEPIDDHRQPLPGRPQEHAAHGGYVQSAHLAQNVQHIVFVRPVQGQGIRLGR